MGVFFLQAEAKPDETKCWTDGDNKQRKKDVLCSCLTSKFKAVSAMLKKPKNQRDSWAKDGASFCYCA